MSTPETLTYFAYGSNVDPEMIEAIIGRVPTTEPAELFDYELVIQQPHQIPERVKSVLLGKWAPEEIDQFRSYAIRPKIGERVVSLAMEVTPRERELLDNWELNDGLWYKKEQVTIKTPSRGLISATTEILDDPDLLPAAEVEPSGSAFVVPKLRMLEVARAVRAEHLARQ